jgi:hypothetical protein
MRHLLYGAASRICRRFKSLSKLGTRMSILKVRPIGQRIRQCLSVIESNHAPMTAREVWNHLEGVSIENSSKYCLRAVELGLMTVNRETRHNQFQCVGNWKLKLEQRQSNRVVERKTPVPLHKMINSVWSLAL